MINTLAVGDDMTDWDEDTDVHELPLRAPAPAIVHDRVPLDVVVPRTRTRPIGSITTRIILELP